MKFILKIVNFFKKPKPEPKFELTDWYPEDIKPVREGIYQTKSVLFDINYYMYWDGKQWCYLSDKEPCLVQDREWRGLTK